MNAIAITTINKPTAAVKMLTELSGFKLFVAGDNKSPKNWKWKNVNYFSIEYQRKTYPTFSRLVAENHYARKNFAYIAAVKSGAQFIYETDDDNFPCNFFPNFLSSETFMNEICAPLCFNIYSTFTKKRVWPRGIPLNYIKNGVVKKKKIKVKPLIQQSLTDLDPDVDAIYRLTNGNQIAFDKNKKMCLAKGTFTPFNSQNTYWDKKVFPLLYLPSTVDSRVTDIWRGYIAQKILWEMDSKLIFLSPSVYQERNIHNLMRDFQQELDLYLKTGNLLDCLCNLKLSGNTKEMLTQTYTHLARNGFFQNEELRIVREWLKLIEV